ncbi:hypothetical protein [Ralstonia pseudosolanacearum]|uniref:Uncharacterized protein n=1 Tax=Ralstonia solanacearum TaxID=305 RepID=A0AA92Q8J0_RALSL|nr:hypothetical protein [Ralstonia pseudosolanacearum]QOK93885.1 hypothetical protein HF908_20655 [Ralstonia pseudosolanacearum]QOK98749.1 hypothetical protein HF909_20175 [Ralstonia pseudosolanacearum]UWD88308.1 hypothetical protein NY025_06250 [Ralstonia pseudosolanacearum]
MSVDAKDAGRKPRRARRVKRALAGARWPPLSWSTRCTACAAGASR